MDQPESFLVTHLFATFREALIALVPSAQAVSITWEDHDKYDEWEAIEEVLYQVLVVKSVCGDVRQFSSSRPFPEYDSFVVDYGDRSWFEVVLPDEEGQFALMRFLSSKGAFSTVEVVPVDQRGPHADAKFVVPWSPELQFLAQLRAPTGALTPVHAVTPTES